MNEYRVEYLISIPFNLKINSSINFRELLLPDNQNPVIKLVTSTFENYKKRYQ